MKQCITCLILLPVIFFHKNRKHIDGLQNKCKICCRVYMIKYYNKNKSKMRVNTRNHNYRKYGINDEVVRKEKEKRNYKCDICLRTFSLDSLVPDHNHKNMKFRGILCYQCNNCLGWYENNKNNIICYILKQRKIIQKTIKEGKEPK